MKNRIGALRRERGLTLKQMGEILGIRDNTLSQYETGKREPQLGLMLEIANFFGVSLEYLFGETEIRDFPTDTEEECISLLKRIKNNEVTYSHISVEATLQLLLWVTENYELIQKKYPDLIESAYFLRKYVESDNKSLSWYSEIRKKNNEIINEIVDLLEFEEKYYGATPKEVLEFMKESNRIEYDKTKKILDYMKSLPDAEKEDE